MTNKEYCDTLKVGEVVLFGQVLSAMKRKGHIESYHRTFKYCDGRTDLMQSFEYLGNSFTMSYFDGCINPYVKKTGPKKESESGVRHRMCLYGTII